MDVLELLISTGAVSNDQHFVYASGRHGSTYMNLDRILPDVALMTSICRGLASPFQGRVEAVAAPAVGGIVLAVLTAQALSEGGIEIQPSGPTKCKRVYSGSLGLASPSDSAINAYWLWKISLRRGGRSQRCAMK
jgi:orotate phosphoribosyltransferase